MNSFNFLNWCKILKSSVTLLQTVSPDRTPVISPSLDPSIFAANKAGWIYSIGINLPKGSHKAGNPISNNGLKRFLICCPAFFISSALALTSFMDLCLQIILLAHMMTKIRSFMFKSCNYSLENVLSRLIALWATSEVCLSKVSFSRTHLCNALQARASLSSIMFR